MEEQSIYRRAKPWQIRLYTLAPGGIGNCFYLLMMYVSYIANVGYGIVATVAGIILTCTRIFDGVTDPICAFISDRISTKYGKIRILLAVGWAIMALSCWLMFIGGIGGGIVYFIAVYCLYIVGYTITSVASNIATPVITNDPKQRPLLARWQNIWTMATMMVLNMVVAALSVAVIGYTAVLPQPNDPASTPILILTIIMTLGMPILGWLCTIFAMKFYPLTTEKMVEVQTKAHEIREAANQATEKDRI